MAGLARQQARKFYDRFAARQDRQGWYEDVALDRLVALGRFEECRSILEIGCGTGRLAQRILARHGPSQANYTGVDIAAGMVALARRRLAPFANRARVLEVEGGFDYDSLGGPFDRIVSTYVLDLLSPGDIAACLAGARRVASEDCLLCLAGLAPGEGVLTGAVSSLWKVVWKTAPRLVGGCRPIKLEGMVEKADWAIVASETVSAWAITSQVIVAGRFKR